MRKLFLLLALSAVIWSCKDKNDDDDYIITGSIEVVPDSVVFSSKVDSAYLSVFINTLYSNNMIEWSAKSDQTWCLPSPAYDRGSKLVKVKVDENITKAQRVAYVTIRPRHSSIEIKVKIIQDPLAQPVL